MPQTCLSDTGQKIVYELTQAVKRIDPQNMGLLVILGSWGDTLPDDEILGMLRKLNSMDQRTAPRD